jgi:carbamoyltransferase
MHILGISCFFHDSAAVLLKDGIIVSASEEERFSRQKHDSGIPLNAIESCLTMGHIGLAEVDYLCFYEDPLLKGDRLIESVLAEVPRSWPLFRKVCTRWIPERRQVFGRLRQALLPLSDIASKPEMVFSVEHHLSHAASAFFPSPFSEAAILVVDGVGEWSTTTISVGTDNTIERIAEIKFPHSIGLLYSAFTHFLGFRVNSGEYKVMGLAPYGVPKFEKVIRDRLIDLREDGSFRLNLEMFPFTRDGPMYSEEFARLFPCPPRYKNDPLSSVHSDIAASIQAVLNDAMCRLAAQATKLSGSKNLCLAGGVALNCVANGKILQGNIVDNLWIQPASGDAGGALGAALALHHIQLGQKREPSCNRDNMRGALLGPSFSQQSIERSLTALGAQFQIASDIDLLVYCAKALNRGEILGWFQGQMEFGPRALGNRSILADARDPAMREKLNEKIKLREGFRPFGPAVLSEYCSQWFDAAAPSPYMLITAELRNDSLPSVTHVDRSARLQTVTQETNPRFHALLTKFYDLTGCPVLVNTSFNVRGEPIVCTPEDAYRCFMTTDIDLLAIGNCLLRKNAQPPRQYNTAFLED